VLEEVLKTPHPENFSCYQSYYKVSDLDFSFGMAWAMEERHEILQVEGEESA
jgi:hypothetical protein